MISDLINMAKTELMDKVSQNTPLDSQQAAESIEIGGNSIFDSLKQEVLSGNMSGVMQVFSGGLNPETAMSNPIVSSIAKNFIGSLISRLGLSEQMSATVVNFVLPYLLSFLGNKAKQNPQEM